MKRAVILFSCCPVVLSVRYQPSCRAWLVTGPGIPAEILMGTRCRNRTGNLQNSCVSTGTNELEHPVPCCHRQRVLQPLTLSSTEPVCLFQCVCCVTPIHVNNFLYIFLFRFFFDRNMSSSQICAFECPCSGWCFVCVLLNCILFGLEHFSVRNSELIQAWSPLQDS